MKVASSFTPSFFILHPCLLRDSVIGNKSSFEPEDEGSTPSPATNLSTQRKKSTSIVIIRQSQ